MRPSGDSSARRSAGRSLDGLELAALERHGADVVGKVRMRDAVVHHLHHREHAAAAFAGGLGIGDQGQAAPLPVVGLAGLGRAEARARPRAAPAAEGRASGDEPSADAPPGTCTANCSRIVGRNARFALARQATSLPPRPVLLSGHRSTCASRVAAPHGVDMHPALATARRPIDAAELIPLAAAGRQPLFFFGTLTDLDVLAYVLERPIDLDDLVARHPRRAIAVCRPRASATRCSCADPCGAVEGRLLRRATRRDIARINHFESGEYRAELHAVVTDDWRDAAGMALSGPGPSRRHRRALVAGGVAGDAQAGLLRRLRRLDGGLPR